MSECSRNSSRKGTTRSCSTIRRANLWRIASLPMAYAIESPITIPAISAVKLNGIDKMWSAESTPTSAIVTSSRTIVLTIIIGTKSHHDPDASIRWCNKNGDICIIDTVYRTLIRCREKTVRLRTELFLRRMPLYEQLNNSVVCARIGFFGYRRCNLFGTR